MDREQLQEMYEDGDLDDSSELQRLRDEIHRYTGLRVPRSVPEIEAWWSNNKAIFSRRIKPSDLSEEESGEEDTVSDGDNE